MPSSLRCVDNKIYPNIISLNFLRQYLDSLKKTKENSQLILQQPDRETATLAVVVPVKVVVVEAEVTAVCAA